METYGGTRKRKDLEGEGDSSKERKSKRTSFDMMTFRRGKMDPDNEMKRQQLEAGYLSFNLYFLDPFGTFFLN